MIVDAHQHFWVVARGDYHWMTPEMTVLARDYLPVDLAPALARAGVSRTIVVQAAATEAETTFLLDLADQTDFVAGVVGWLDLDADDFPAKLVALERRRKFVGVRPMIHDIADDRWMLRPRVLAHLGLLAERHVPFEFLTCPRHLPHVARVLERVPRLSAVIDHLSKPPIAAGTLAPWRDAMRDIATSSTVYCKLSGLVTEARHDAWTLADLAPVVADALDVFGPDRVMFGSDWPVCLLAASYAEVVNALRTVVDPLLDHEGMGAVFGGNARRFYRVC